jgi:prepilin-type N-terminal cleavage/methylation domain-containing protein
MSKRIHSLLGRGGYSLIEVLLVAAILGICLAIGSLSLARGLRTQVARGSAQSWQAAAAWAQIGVLWQGGAVRLSYAPGALSLSHDFGLCGGELGSSAPPVPATTNLARWRDGIGVAVEFSGALGSPDGGGSIYFDALAGRYRVVVRPGSGLTARTRVEEGP